MKKQELQEDRYTINSIEKALDVLEILSQHKSLNLIELATILNKPKSSLFRIISTLEKREYITRNEDDGKYCVGFKPLELTKNLLEGNTLRNCAASEINHLADKYGDTVNLGVLSDGDVLYIEIIEGTYSLRMNESVGSRGPYHATGIGKAIAAFLPAEKLNRLIEEKGFPSYTPNTIQSKEAFLNELAEIKNKGYSIDNEEVVQGARCIAAPVFNLSGKVEGAVSLSGTVHRYPLGTITEVAKDVKLAAANISRKLGYFDK
jgi:DNA-binding IclR family transcriptional regulator